MCAYALGIPLEKVSVKPSNNLVAANAMFTGASVTSEGITYVSLNNERLKRKKIFLCCFRVYYKLVICCLKEYNP